MTTNWPGPGGSRTGDNWWQKEMARQMDGQTDFLFLFYLLNGWKFVLFWQKLFFGGFSADFWQFTGFLVVFSWFSKYDFLNHKQTSIWKPNFENHEKTMKKLPKKLWAARKLSKNQKFSYVLCLKTTKVLWKDYQITDFCQRSTKFQLYWMALIFPAISFRFGFFPGRPWWWSWRNDDDMRKRRKWLGGKWSTRPTHFWDRY